MADELVLYTNPMSRGRVARWMLEEVGEPYRVEVLDYASTMKGLAYLAINPMAKVPALRHGDAVVTETAAICAYLADAFPQVRLAPPPGDRLRARPIIAGCSLAPARSKPPLVIKSWASSCRQSASG
jgi:glutathione S-transferase